MALAHTILTVLIQAPCSGYDVSKRFEEDLGCYWRASQQQIYRELSKMEQQGWVFFETVPQAGKPDKKIYAITEAGREELRRWYGTPTEPTPIREDLLVKVVSATHMPHDLLLQELHHRRQTHLEQLQKYRGVEAEYFALEQPDPNEEYRYLTLRRGIRYEQSWVAWCDEVIDHFEGATDCSQRREGTTNG